MKRLILLAALLPFLGTQAVAQESAPFSLLYYGKFQKMVHTKNTDGVVNLSEATSGPNLYGVGAPAHGTGEITLVDGKLWLDYGADGLGNAVHTATVDEQAVLLVTAEVKSWTESIVPSDMNATQMQEFILTEAASHGIDTGTAFPFLLEGNSFDFDWHILNGLKPNGGHNTGGLFEKVNQQITGASGLVVGFYSAALQGVYTHPNESWHLHVVFEDKGMAGHIDAIFMRSGTVLKLPVN